MSKMFLIVLFTLNIMGTFLVNRTSDYEIKTNYHIDHNWIKLPTKTGSLNVQLITRNQIEKVSFWLVPMGTSSWKFRTLLGIDDNGTDGWRLEWQFSNTTIYDHIVIEISRIDGETDSYILNVSNQ